MHQARWPLRFSIAVTIALYAVTFQQPAAGITLGVFCLLTLLPPRIEVDLIGQIIVALVCLVGAYILTVQVDPAPQHPLSEFFALARAFFCVWALLYSCLLMLFTTPLLRPKANLLVVWLAAFSCGGDKRIWSYIIGMSLFTLFALWTLAKADADRPSLREATPKRKLVLAIHLLASSAVAIGLMISLPLLYQWITQRIGESLAQRQQAGFSMYMQLGSLQSLLQSNRVVMRLYGTPSQGMRLRGIVYNRYFNRNWSTAYRRQPTIHPVTRLDEKKDYPYLIEYASQREPRFFAPLHATALALPEGRLRIDRMGILLPFPRESPTKLAFQIDPTHKRTIDPPERDDLMMTPLLVRPLTSLATAWTAHVKEPHEKIRALVAKLQRDYRYSLRFEREKHTEPLLGFLFKDKQGHCEYFASALALLSRSLGIPARVIGGYIVSEINPLGNYAIVREKNAHAWVEVWLPQKGGWQSFDATPPAPLSTHMAARSGYIAGLLDLLWVKLNALQAWLLSLTLTQILSIIGSFVLFWLLLRLWRYLRQRQQKNQEDPLNFRPPSPAFSAFLQRLDALLPKKESESIEAYARRLQAHLPSESIQQAAQILSRYAAYRYGQIGNQAEIEQLLHAWKPPFHT